jgi:hypothetical protein
LLRRDGGISVNVWDFYDFGECYVRENYVVPPVSLIEIFPYWESACVILESTMKPKRSPIFRRPN